MDWIPVTVAVIVWISIPLYCSGSLYKGIDAISGKTIYVGRVCQDLYEDIFHSQRKLARRVKAVTRLQAATRGFFVRKRWRKECKLCLVGFSHIWYCSFAADQKAQHCYRNNDHWGSIYPPLGNRPESVLSTVITKFTTIAYLTLYWTWWRCCDVRASSSMSLLVSLLEWVTCSDNLELQ